MKRRYSLLALLLVLLMALSLIACSNTGKVISSKPLPEFVPTEEDIPVVELAEPAVDLSLEPIGSRNETQIEATFKDGVATFNITDGENTIVYQVNTESAAVISGLIEVQVSFNGSEPINAVAKAGLSYLTTSGDVLSAENFAAAATTQMAYSFDPTAQTLTLDYLDEYEGVKSTRTYVFAPKGYSLLVSVESGSARGLGGYHGFETGVSSGLESSAVYTSVYAEEISVTDVNGEYFLSAYLDRAKSNSTKLMNYPAAEVNGSYHGMQVVYELNSAGQKNPISERFYITVSDAMLDCVFLTNAEKSEYRDQLNDQIIYDNWTWDNTYLDRADNFTSLAEDFLMTDVTLVEHRWQYGTLDIANPVHYPANDGQWGSVEDFESYIAQVKEAGWDLVLHEDYWFNQPFEGNYYYYNIQEYFPEFASVEEALAQDADGNPLVAWTSTDASYVAALGGKEYISYSHRSDMMAKYADLEGKKIEAAYDPQGSFLDVNGGVNPLWMKQLTYNAESAYGRTAAQVYADNAVLFETVRNNYQGPVMSEGAQGAVHSVGSIYAGWLDSSSREITSGSQALIMPDYELKYIRELMVSQGMGPPARFATAGGESINFDKYNATAIAYGHTGFIGDSHYAAGVDTNEIINVYYMFRALQPQYLDTSVEVESILYYDESGNGLALEEALRADYPFRTARLYIAYSNGLEIYLNFSADNWVVELNGNEYVLDTNGWAAENPNEAFVEYSCLVNGTRVDYVSCKDYTYINTRSETVDFGDGYVVNGLFITTADGESVMRSSLMSKASFMSLSTGVHGEKGLTYYMTTDGVELVPFENFVADGGSTGNGAWINDDGTWMDTTFYIGVPSQNENFILGKTGNKFSLVMGYEAQADAILNLETWAAAYSSDYEITISFGSLDNVVDTFSCRNQTVATNNYSFEVKTGDMVYLKYTPLDDTEDAHFGTMNAVYYTFSEKVEEEEPVEEPTGDSVSMSFQSLSTGVQGENGLTYYMSADGVKLVPFANFVADGGNTGNGAWINDDGTVMDITFVQGDPNQNPDFMVGKVHDKGSLVMEYKAQDNRALKLSTWTAAYASDFTVTIASGTLDNVIATYDVASGAVGTGEYEFTPAAGDVIYLIYTPKTPAEGVHFGVMNTVTLTGSAEPSSISYQKLSTGVQGEKGLTYYMSADGVKLVPFANFVADGGNTGNGAWINDDGTVMDITFVQGDPNQNPDFMVGKVHDKGSLVMEYKAQDDRAFKLSTWTAAYASDFTVTVASGTLDNVIATYDVASGAVGTGEYEFTPAAGDVIYLIYTPKTPAEGVHFGVMNTIVYAD